MITSGFFFEEYKWWSTTLDEFKDWFRDYKITKPIAQLCECIETWCDWTNVFSPSHALRAKLIQAAHLYEIPSRIKSEGKSLHRNPLDIWVDLGEKLQHEVFSWLDDLDQMRYELNGVTPQERNWSTPYSRITRHKNRLYCCYWEFDPEESWVRRLEGSDVIRKVSRYDHLI